MNFSYTMGELASISGGRLVCGDAQARWFDFSTDTRRIYQGEDTLFVALQGPQHDGHEYVKAAMDKGVVHFLLSEIPQDIDRSKLNIVQVSDTLKALQSMMGHHRLQFTCPIIGVTGSNGKTIVKEWLNLLLSDDFQIARSPNSYNSQVGVALSLWNLRKEHSLGIFEAGISQPGEMKNLQEMIRPNIGVLTNIGMAHIENFETAQQHVEEKIDLFGGCDLVVVPSRYSQAIEALAKRGMNTKTWGYKNSDDLQIQVLRSDSISTELKARFGDVEHTLHLEVADEASVENALTCILVLLELGYDFDSIQQRLYRLKTLAMRLEFIDGIHQSYIINDAYSLDVNSLRIALEMLKKKAQGKKKMVVLGAIHGIESAQNRHDLYHELLQSEIREAHLIGKYPELEIEGLDLTVHKNKADFLRSFDPQSISNAVVLVKGRRKDELEDVVKAFQKKSHETVLEIDMEALRQNINAYRSKLNPGVKLMIMVKAFSYGSGGWQIAQMLQFNHVDYLGVAFTDEGVELRNEGISTPIMVMNPEPASFADCISHHLEPVIFNLDMLSDFVKQVPSGDQVKIHIKLDTGMHRLGFVESELKELIQFLHATDRVQVGSCFTHLSSADIIEEDDFTGDQLKRFDKMTADLEDSLGIQVIRHALNTSGIERFGDNQYDMVRLGIGLYGISSSKEMTDVLAPAAALKSTIAQIKTIPAGSSVGYGRSFKASGETKVGVIPIGYADGFSRAMSNGVGEVFVRGQKAPVIGRVCMDMTMVDLTGIKCETGDEVVLFDAEHPVELWAERLNTIPYEIMTSISSRVKRVYINE